MKKIHLLKKEKEALAVNYEQEEEFLTNDLSRKLTQVYWMLCLILHHPTSTTIIMCSGYHELLNYQYVSRLSV